MVESFSYWYYSGEHRHRCPASLNHPIGDHETRTTTGNHYNTTSIATDLEASSSSSIGPATINTNDGDAHQNKYNKKSKTFLQQQQKWSRLLAQQTDGSYRWMQSHKQTIAQTTAILMLLIGLLNIWYHGRAFLWWTTNSHSRHLLLDPESSNNMINLYQRAEERIRQIHESQLLHQQEPQEQHDNDKKVQERKRRVKAFQQLQHHSAKMNWQPARPQAPEVVTAENEVSNSNQRTPSTSEKQRREQEMIIEKELSALSTEQLQDLFLQEQDSSTASWTTSNSVKIHHILTSWLEKVDQDILNNVHGGIRWISPSLLPPLPSQQAKQPATTTIVHDSSLQVPPRLERLTGKFYEVERSFITQPAHFKWEDEWEEMVRLDSENTLPLLDVNDENDEAHTARDARRLAQPIVDYTNEAKYRYPHPLLEEPPVEGGYPQMTSLGLIMEQWDQDEDLDGTFTETLLHFNFSDPVELEMARKFRDAELPFKLTEVPELVAANLKWTDEYVSEQFDKKNANGEAQESPNHFFAFYKPEHWNVHVLGLTPYRNNDWTFEKWSQHARYADAKRLSPDQPHFYWHSGVDKTERQLPREQWTFISRDLPSFSSETENFLVFHPEKQKGIQCRFGERGVVAATHNDSGRNMVAMIAGAKRYILSPPNACNKLGIFTDQQSPIFRHSLLNFGHIKYLNNNNDSNSSYQSMVGLSMSPEERAWLERASQAQAVETVLKAGEVLYIPSHWFHYIISLQKSAQCNVRSGPHANGTFEFGGLGDVREGMC